MLLIKKPKGPRGMVVHTVTDHMMPTTRQQKLVQDEECEEKRAVDQAPTRLAKNILCHTINGGWI